MKCREIFFIILVIFILIGGCGGSGGDSSSSTSTSGGSITLAWDAVTTRADGSPLTDLQGYWIYYGPSPGLYSARVYVGNVTTYTLTGLTPGQTYYIAATAIDQTDNESSLSTPVSGPAK